MRRASCLRVAGAPDASGRLARPEVPASRDRPMPDLQSKVRLLRCYARKPWLRLTAVPIHRQKEHLMTLIASPAVSADTRAHAAPALDVHPVGGRIGAEVRGLRLSPDLEESTIAAINSALLRHKVIFFRGQSHLDDAAQEAFARRFGETVAHPTVPSVAGGTRLLELDSRNGNRANSWHTDVTFVAAYPKISI